MKPIEKVEVSSSLNQSVNFEVIETSDLIKDWIANKFLLYCKVSIEDIDYSKPFSYYGLDSLKALTIIGELEEWLGIEIPSTLLWDYPTIDKAGDYLFSELNQ